MLSPTRRGSKWPAIQSLLRLGFSAVDSLSPVKGVGGYQLACDATSETAVGLLRRRKHRPHQPSAVMVADIETARELFEVDGDEEVLLCSWRLPITLVRDRGLLAPSVAPGHLRQGVMLASSPLHHLLLEKAARPLVMTSGNRSGEPICIDDADALDRLGEFADAFLTHDRRIVARCDDSVVTLRQGAATVLRRARGWAPEPVRLPVSVRPSLAVGAQLQSTFCLAAGDHAYVSQHIGDLDNDSTLSAYCSLLDRHRQLFGIEPEIVAHDLHPDLLSTRLAETLGLPRVAVQHHHAHVVSVMAEHALRGPVIGVAFDGFGLGTDGTGWGKEFFIADWGEAERVGWFRPVRQPGGDAAVRHPWRMALAFAADVERIHAARGLLAGAAEPAMMDVVASQVRGGLAAPWTSSVGRLFDAVAALGRVCTSATYEAHPAVLLEQIADPAAKEPHTLLSEGIDQLLPDRLELVHGPGCPVCVTPLEVIDQAIALARRSEVTLCSFGDMLRIPGSDDDLQRARAAGADVRVVYSPLDAVQLAADNPGRTVVFLAVGFETTAPTTAMAVRHAERLELDNFTMLTAHVLVPPAMTAILMAPGNRVQGFLAPGHVCTINGWIEYELIAQRFEVPIVVTGFDTVDVIHGLVMLVAQLEAGEHRVDNQYVRSVTRTGNEVAQQLVAEVFEPCDRPWRGIGTLPLSGLRLRRRYERFDALSRFPDTTVAAVSESPLCMAGLVLQGQARPNQCPAFASGCTPEHPLGAPMVSSEGACSAYFLAGRQADHPR